MGAGSVTSRCAKICHSHASAISPLNLSKCTVVYRRREASTESYYITGSQWTCLPIQQRTVHFHSHNLPVCAHGEAVKACDGHEGQARGQLSLSHRRAKTLSHQQSKPFFITTIISTIIIAIITSLSRSKLSSSPSRRACRISPSNITMFPNNMTTGWSNAIRGWSKLGDNGNTSSPTNNTEGHPVTATQVSRTDGTIDIEMQNLNEAQNEVQNNAQNEARNQTTQTNKTNGHNPVWFPVFLGIALFLTSVGLFNSNGRTETLVPTWTREGSVEKLTPIQVIFAEYPRRFIWARFTAFMCIQVVILGLVRGYAMWAVSTTSTTKAKILMWFKDLFFAVAVVLSAICQWGWLIWQT
jgi:hypothetical protein